MSKKKSNSIEFKSIYQTLSKINIKEHVEKKGAFKYLSWVFAFDTLSKYYSWYHEDAQIVKIGDTAMIKTVVVIEDVPRRMHLAVTDFYNKPIHNPESVDIANTIMRCLVKNIAVFGLGFNLYAGEDLPIGEEIEPPKPIEQTKPPKPTPPPKLKQVEEMPRVKQEYVDKMVDIAEERYGKGDKFPVLLAWLQYKAEGCIDLFASKNMIESQIFELSEKQLSAFAYKSARDYLLKTLNEDKQQGETK